MKLSPSVWLAVLAWTWSLFSHAANTGRELVSVPPAFTQATANGFSAGPILSRDGRFILFQSSAANLPARTGDPLPFQNVFLADRQMETMSLVSVSQSGFGGANRNATGAAFSSNGRFVVFASAASNLATGGTNNVVEIFLRDLQENATTLISRRREEMTPFRRDSFTPGISADGERIVYASASRDIAPLTAGTAVLFYLFARSTSANRAILSQNLGAAVFTVTNFNPLISPGGNLVLFESRGTNVVTRGPTYGSHVFANDLQASQTHWVSTNVMRLLGRAATTPGNSQIRGISDDGQIILFVTTDVPAVSGTSRTNYLFRHHLPSQTSRIIATNMLATTESLAMTPDGQFIVFALGGNVYRWDLQSDTRFLVSQQLNGNPLTGTTNTSQLNISEDGRFVSFYSDGQGLIQGATGPLLYRRDMQQGTTTIVSRRIGDNLGLNGQVFDSSMDATGSLVAYSCDDTLTVPNDNNRCMDVFLWNESGPAIISPVSRADPAAAQAGFRMLSYSTQPLSADGRFVVFSGISPRSFGHPEIWLRDRRESTTTIIGASEPFGFSHKAMISSDGRWIAYETTSSNLVASINDTNGVFDVVLFDRSTASHRQVTRNATGDGTARYPSTLEAMSPDGRYLLIGSINTTFSDPADPPPLGTSGNVIYLWDRATGAFRMLTRGSGGAGVRGRHYGFAFSPESQRAAFIAIGAVTFEDASTGATRTANAGEATLLIYDIRAQRLRGLPAAPLGSTPQRAAVFSPEGRKLVTTSLRGNGGYSIAFIDLATWNITEHLLTELRPTQLSTSFDAAFTAYRFETGAAFPYSSAIFGYDFLSTENIRISLEGDIFAKNPFVHPGGQVLYHQTSARSERDSNTFSDIYASSRTEAALPLTRSFNGEFAANGSSMDPRLSPDFSTLLFASFASDLVSLDANAGADLYAITLSSPNSGAPVISRGPFAGEVPIGEPAWFFVVAEPNAEPLSYQWYRGSTPIEDGPRISGARGATLVIEQVDPGDAALYHVVVSNNSGSTRSAGALLEVVAPRLSITGGAGTPMRISWPAPSAGFILQSSPALGPNANWLPHSQEPTLSNNRYIVELQPSETALFFRLRHD